MSFNSKLWEYATKEACAAGCTPKNEGETMQCVYSYWTGCWLCIPTGWESLYPETDPANIRDAGKGGHDGEGHAAPATGPPGSTYVKPDVGEESVLEEFTRREYALAACGLGALILALLPLLLHLFGTPWRPGKRPLNRGPRGLLDKIADLV